MKTNKYRDYDIYKLSKKYGYGENKIYLYNLSYKQLFNCSTTILIDLQ